VLVKVTDQSHRESAWRARELACVNSFYCWQVVSSQLAMVHGARGGWFWNNMCEGERRTHDYITSRTIVRSEIVTGVFFKEHEVVMNFVFGIRLK